MEQSLNSKFGMYWMLRPVVLCCCRRTNSLFGRLFTKRLLLNGAKKQKIE